MLLFGFPEIGLWSKIRPWQLLTKYDDAWCQVSAAMLLWNNVWIENLYSCAWTNWLCFTIELICLNTALCECCNPVFTFWSSNSKPPGCSAIADQQGHTKTHTSVVNRRGLLPVLEIWAVFWGVLDFFLGKRVISIPPCPCYPIQCLTAKIIQ